MVCAILVECIIRNISVKLYSIWTMVKQALYWIWTVVKEASFNKDVSIFSSGGNFAHQRWTACAILRGHYQEHFCEFIINLDQWLRRYCLKIFLFSALTAILFWRWSRTLMILYTVKPVLSGHSKTDKTKVFKTNGNLMKVESIAECSLGALCNTLTCIKR